MSAGSSKVQIIQNGTDARSKIYSLLDHSMCECANSPLRRKILKRPIRGEAPDLDLVDQMSMDAML